MAYALGQTIAQVAGENPDDVLSATLLAEQLRGHEARS